MNSDEFGQIDETVTGLYKLSEIVIELLKESKRYHNQQIRKMCILYSQICDAIELLASYEESINDKDDDLSHEFGMSYSNIMESIEEDLNDLKESGISIIMQ